MSAKRVPLGPCVGAVVGVAFIVVGVRSLVGDPSDTRPSATVAWVIGLAAAHDLVGVPLVLAVGEAVRRFAPRSARPWLGAGLLISGSIGLVAWPLVRGYGRLAGNPSILPRDYGVGAAITLSVVWVSVIAAGLLADPLRRRRAATGVSPQSGAADEG